MRIRLLLCCLAVVGLLAPGSDAALKKYRLQRLTSSNSSNVSPNPDNLPRGNSDLGEESQSVALIDETAPNPVLHRLVDATDQTTTVPVPGLTTAIFISNNLRQGPGRGIFDGGDVPSFTGTGSTGSSIRWGIVTGWTVSGSFWCNSNPALLCVLAMGVDEGTADARFNSEFYDLGTWFFHSTGFTASPYINSYNPNDPGNVVYVQKGFRKFDGTVPALPLMGALLLGGSLLAGGVTALRQRRD